MTQQIDIIYCFRNRDLKRVKNSLDSLSSQNNKSFRVIFIDYGSEDTVAQNTKKLCDEYSFCNYHFIDTQGKTWSRADALNYGFSISKANYVFTSDIDMVFVNHFVTYLQKNISDDIASFFSVGYLSELATRSLNVEKIAQTSYTKSKDFALGMVFISKSILNRINGYNSFYSLWGAEDNDIKYRIEEEGFKTRFIEDEIFMLHQYHPESSNDGSVLPAGWIQFMKDYQEGYKNKPFKFNGLNEITLPLDRPAKRFFQTDSINFEKITSRNLFIRYRLMRDISNQSEKEGLFYEFGLDELPKSTVIKFGEFLGNAFGSVKIPLTISSAFEAQYTTKNKVRDEIYCALKCLDSYIKDYYLEISENNIKLIVVKK
jgi:hypothetical protein